MLPSLAMSKRRMRVMSTCSLSSAVSACDLGDHDAQSRRLLRMISAVSRHLVVELEVVGAEHVLDGLVRDDAGVGRVGGGEGGVEHLPGRDGIMSSCMRSMMMCFSLVGSEYGSE